MFFGVVAVDEALNRGEVSNVASAYRPGTPPTTLAPGELPGYSVVRHSEAYLELTDHCNAM